MVVQQAIQRAEPILLSMGKKVFHAAMRTGQMANNTYVGDLYGGTSEAQNLVFTLLIRKFIDDYDESSVEIGRAGSIIHVRM